MNGNVRVVLLHVNSNEKWKGLKMPGKDQIFVLIGFS